MTVKGAVKLYKSFRERTPKRIGKIDFVVPRAVACIGYVEGIDYKTTHGSKVTLYHHDFAPGSRPLLCVSADGKQLLMLGGRYQFTERGIVDRDAAGDEIENAGHGKYINPRAVTFGSLNVGDRFDFVEPGSLRNSFYLRCEKLSARGYVDEKGVRHQIGALRAKVYNVVPAGNCAWFAGCGAVATGVAPHPILGEVPACDRCMKLATEETRRVANSVKLRQKEVFAQLRAVGIAAKKTGFGKEIRLAYAGLKGEAQEKSAAYTEDLGDALATGTAMVAERNALIHKDRVREPDED
jgi:hypothetical protein